MGKRIKQEVLSATEIERFEEGTERICKDFEVFCSYTVENEVKLSARTGNIGNKDCFQLNQLLSFQESYEKGTYPLEKYALINFFQNFALQFYILEAGNGKKKNMIVKGRSYEKFSCLSQTARYLMFLSYYLSDQEKDPIGYIIRGKNREREAILEFCAAATPGTLIPIQRGDSLFVYNLYSYSSDLRIFQSMNICDTKFLTNPTPYRQDLTPLVESVMVQEMGILVGKLFGKVKMKDSDKWIRLIYEEKILEYYIEAFGKCLVKEEVESMRKLLEVELDPPRQQVYKLEISLYGYGCKRIIEIDSKSSLSDLHDYIQEIFEFDNDHLYSFTIGTGKRKKEICSPLMEEKYSTDEVTLGELGLDKGQEFTYLFDFGDCWHFTIKVKGSHDGTLASPKTIEAVGKAPEQYPDWDEEDAEDSDDWEL